MCACVSVRAYVCETARQLGPPETWTFSYTVIASKRTDNNAPTFLLGIVLILFPLLLVSFLDFYLHAHVSSLFHMVYSIFRDF